MCDGCVIVSILPGEKEGGGGIKKPSIKKFCLMMAIFDI